MNRRAIMQSISDALALRLPGWQANQNVRRKDFTRPAFLLEYVTSTQEDGGLRVVRCTDYFALTLYVETDPYYDSDRGELVDAVSAVMSLFSRTHLLADGRALNLQASGAGSDENQAYIDLQTTYFEARETDEETYQTMDDVQVTIQKED